MMLSISPLTSSGLLRTSSFNKRSEMGLIYKVIANKSNRSFDR